MLDVDGPLGQVDAVDDPMRPGLDGGQRSPPLATRRAGARRAQQDVAPGGPARTHQPISPNRDQSHSGGLNIRGAAAAPSASRAPSAVADGRDGGSFVRGADAHRLANRFEARDGSTWAAWGSNPGARPAGAGRSTFQAGRRRRRSRPPGHRVDEGLGPGRDRVIRLDAPAARRAPSAVAARGRPRAAGRPRPIRRASSPGTRSLPAGSSRAGTPTGLATTGSPAAWYWRTFRPHLPRLQRSSGSQLTPICPAASCRASSPRPRGPRRPASGSRAGKRSQITRSRRPGTAAARAFQIVDGLLQAPERARRADPDQVDGPVGGFAGARPGSAAGRRRSGSPGRRSTLAPARRAQSARKSLPATTVSADVARSAANRRRRRRLSGPRGSYESRKRTASSKSKTRRRAAGAGCGAASAAGACAAGSRRRIARARRAGGRANDASLEALAGQRPARLLKAGAKARIRYRQQTWSGDSTRASRFIPSSLTVGGHPPSRRGVADRPRRRQDHNHRARDFQDRLADPTLRPPIEIEIGLSLWLGRGTDTADPSVGPIRGPPAHGRSWVSPSAAPRYMKNFARLVRFALPYGSGSACRSAARRWWPCCSSPSSAPSIRCCRSCSTARTPRSGSPRRSIPSTTTSRRSRPAQAEAELRPARSRPRGEAAPKTLRGRDPASLDETRRATSELAQAGAPGRRRRAAGLHRSARSQAQLEQLERAAPRPSRWPRPGSNELARLQLAAAQGRCDPAPRSPRWSTSEKEIDERRTGGSGAASLAQP